MRTLSSPRYGTDLRVWIS
ncbi:hypothetical protein E2C01_052922 [Portunus trituberculatus]|uniref:Uncharacterized protein n=1 Tax=Portunus trituberculatus TaxID=210409 RepID=A0A5B7GFT9_PORTR|nr:hypothetical protein [Portunus trituberculatus]